MKTVRVEVVDYLNRSYFNRVVRAFVRCPRNLQVDEVDTEFYGEDRRCFATTIDVTNNGYTTFDYRSWEEELRQIINRMDPYPFEGIIYLNVDGEQILLNDSEII